MPGALRLMLQYPLFREVILATVAAGALLLKSSVSKTQVAIGYSAFLFLLPNHFSFLPGKRMPKKKLNWIQDPLVEKKQKETPFMEVLTKQCGGATGERYVVIGGGGFVGERIIHALLLRGEKNIVCVDIALSDFTLKHFKDKVKFMLGSVMDPQFLEEALKGADVVISPMATIRFFDWLPKHLKRSITVNVDGTQRLVDACAKAGVKRFIATGTSNAIYTSDVSPYGLDERAPLATPANGVQCYAVTKAMAETIALKANGNRGMATGVIRPTSQVVGFRDKLSFDRYIKTGTIALYSEYLLDIVDVDDVVLGHLLLEKALRKGCESEAAGETFHICPAEPVTTTEFIRMITEQAQRIKFSKAQFRIEKVPERLIILLSCIYDLVTFLLPASWDIGANRGDLKFLTLSTHATTVLLPTASELRNEKAHRILGYTPHLSTESVINRVLRENEMNQILVE